jgi:hypothetical protein
MWLDMMQVVYKDKPIEEFAAGPTQTTSSPKAVPAASATPQPTRAIVSAQPNTDTESSTQ